MGMCVTQTLGKKASGSFGTHGRVDFLISETLFPFPTLVFESLILRNSHSLESSQPEAELVSHPASQLSLGRGSCHCGERERLPRAQWSDTADPCVLV